jgi:hypothetical protein
VTVSTLEDYTAALSRSAGPSVRGKLHAFARDHAVIL